MVFVFGVDIPLVEIFLTTAVVVFLILLEVIVVLILTVHHLRYAKEFNKYLIDLSRFVGKLEENELEALKRVSDIQKTEQGFLFILGAGPAGKMISEEIRIFKPKRSVLEKLGIKSAYKMPKEEGILAVKKPNLFKRIVFKITNFFIKEKAAMIDREKLAAERIISKEKEIVKKAGDKEKIIAKGAKHAAESVEEFARRKERSIFSFFKKEKDMISEKEKALVQKMIAKQKAAAKDLTVKEKAFAKGAKHALESAEEFAKKEEKSIAKKISNIKDKVKNIFKIRK